MGCMFANACREMLEEAIRAFQGAIIAVSHDRYFLKQVATRVLLVEDQKLKDFKGDYEYYLEQVRGGVWEGERGEEKESIAITDMVLSLAVLHACHPYPIYAE